MKNCPASGKKAKQGAGSPASLGTCRSFRINHTKKGGIMEKNEGRQFENLEQFIRSDFDNDALLNILNFNQEKELEVYERVELCVAFNTLKKFVTKMKNYSIVKKGVDKPDHRIGKDLLLDQAFLNFIEVICSYTKKPERGSYNSIENRYLLDFAKHLAKAGYRITKAEV
jgi:hypothetical protein